MGDLLLSLVTAFPAWVREESALPVAVAGLSLVGLLGASVFLAIITQAARKQRERRGPWSL